MDHPQPASPRRSPGPLTPSPSPLSPGSQTPAAPAPAPPLIPDHELLQCIGRGSYGEVWLARNVLGELRAVKAIYRAHFDADRPYEREFEGLKRYEPVSRTHPSQVAILHVGRNDPAGFYYYVMELADAAGGQRSDGVLESWSHASSPPAQHSITPSLQYSTPYAPHTLKHDLQTRGRLPLEECIRIGRALTTALEHLHGHGLVHRDIKPSNVIFVNGVPKLADIGLVANIDATMSFVGTAGYVPPEGPGKPTGDIYSLGKLLYEISVGRDAAAFPELPTAWKSFADQAGQLEFNAVVLKACSHDPEQRYRTAAEMQEDLKLLEEGKSVRRKRAWAHRRARMLRLAGVMAGALAVAILTYQAFRPSRGAVSPPAVVSTQPSVFVLPIRSPTGYSSYDSPANQIRNRVTDAFIDSLGLIGGVKVGPRKSAWVSEEEAELVRRVRPDYSHILTGRMTGTNDQWELTVSFARGEEAQPLWTEHRAGTTDDLPRMEMAIVERLVGSLGLAVSPTRREQVGQLLTNNLEAYRRYCRGYESFNRFTQVGYREATTYFGQARELDRKFLDAEVAVIQTLRGQTDNRSANEVWTQIRDRTRGVREIDDTHPMARYWFAGSQLMYTWELDEGAAGLFASIAPDDFLDRAYLCWTLGQTNQARIEQARFERQEIGGPMAYSWLSSGAYLDRRYEDGIHAARRSIDLFPNSSAAYVALAHGAVETGRYEEALTAIEEGRKVEEQQDLLGLLAYTYARMGRRDEALSELRRLEKPSPATAYVQPYYIARVYMALGDPSAALTALEKACDERSEWLISIEVFGGLRMDPAWKDLQAEPRFQQLLKRTGLDKWPRELPPGFMRKP